MIKKSIASMAFANIVNGIKLAYPLAKSARAHPTIPAIKPSIGPKKAVVKRIIASLILKYPALLYGTFIKKVTTKTRAAITAL